MQQLFPSHPLRALAMMLWLASGISSSVAAEDCTPEQVENGMAAVTLPAEFPAAIPLPADYFLMNAMAEPASEWNPYPAAMVELLASGSPEQVFAFYETALPKAGYRIVMWEKDVGAMGFRFRSDDIDQGTISINSYDCRVAVMISVSLLP